MLVFMTKFKINLFITTGAASLLSFLMIIKQQAQTAKATLIHSLVFIHSFNCIVLVN